FLIQISWIKVKGGESELTNWASHVRARIRQGFALGQNRTCGPSEPPRRGGYGGRPKPAFRAPSFLSPGRLGGAHLPSQHGAPFREEPVAEAALKIKRSVKRLLLEDPLLLP